MPQPRAVAAPGGSRPQRSGAPAVWPLGAGLGWWVGPKVHCTTFHAIPLHVTLLQSCHC